MESIEKNQLNAALSIMVCFILSSNTLFSQKLPNKQEASLRPPPAVKIDGKVDEWSFAAFNKATDLFYTIANDGKKLYWVFQANDQTVINKIMGGGITILITKSGKETSERGMSITYPYREKNKLIAFSFHKRGEILPPKQLLNQVADSIMMANNKKLASYTKWIYTKGISNMDTLISIYNEQGLEAAQAFNMEKAYNCEIAIDLEHLGLSENMSKFSYQIIVNGGPNKYNGMMWGPSGNGGAISTTTNASIALESINNTEQKLYSTSDFRGEYTLSR